MTQPLSQRPPVRRPPSRARARRGFSMIEILVVIGIILILVGIGVVGFRWMEHSAAQDATRTAMNTAMGMITEYETTGMKADDLGEAVTGSAITAPKDIGPGGAGRYAAPMVKTQEAIGRLRAVPRNRDTLTQLPTKGVMTEKIPTGTTMKTVQTGPNAGRADPPLLLDGWSNPLILVPRAGMTGVTVGDNANLTIKPPDNRPFWASAGPDQDFSTGDDNLYSFESKS